MDIKKIGTKIKNRRTALGLTQKDLAKAVKISNQLVSKWETGESVPSLEYMDALCAALHVEPSFFWQDEVPSAPPCEVKPVPVESNAPAAQAVVRRRVNFKTLLIVLCSLGGALMITSVILLSCFVFVPMSNKARYIDSVDRAMQNYFDGGYYSITLKSYLDGDVNSENIYQGYLDENGSVVCTNGYETVADGIKTEKYDTYYKYRYEQPETIKTLEDLVKAEVFSDVEDDDLMELSDVKYIRKKSYGYYIELSEEYFTKDMSGTEKKNIKLTDKIRGEIRIEDEIFRSMSVTVKFINVPDNEKFTAKSTIEFVAERPQIAHPDLENREWGFDSSDAPRAKNLVTLFDFMSQLKSDAKRVTSADKEFVSALEEEVYYKNGYLYAVGDDNVVIFNRQTLKVDKTVDLEDWAENVYIYNGYIYYRQYGTVYRKNILSGQTESVIDSYWIDVNYNDRYCWGDSWYCDLRENIVTNMENSVRFVDSAGRVYCYDSSGLKIIQNGTVTRIKGEWLERGNGNTVYTSSGSHIYCYVNGVLRLEGTTGDPREVREVSGGYCFVSRYDYSFNRNIYNSDGTVKDSFTAVSLWDGEEYVYCYSMKLCEVCNGKILMIIRTDSGTYLARYNADDCSKPVCYTEIDPENFEIYNINSMIIIAMGNGSGTSEYWIL